MKYIDISWIIKMWANPLFLKSSNVWLINKNASRLIYFVWLIDRNKLFTSYLKNIFKYSFYCLTPNKEFPFMCRFSIFFPWINPANSNQPYPAYFMFRRANFIYITPPANLNQPIYYMPSTQEHISYHLRFIFNWWLNIV